MRRNNRPHSRETAEARAADESHQKSLGLIGHRMSNRNAITARLSSSGQQEVVSNLPRDFFDSPTASLRRRLNIDRTNCDPEAKPIG